MLKQILCCSLLVGQLYAGEHPRTPLPSGMNASEVNAAFMVKFPGVPTELPTIRKESSSSSVSDAQSADQAPTVSEDSDRRKGPKFTGEEDAGIMQYVQDHPRKKQNWEECLKDLTEQGIIAPGARTAKQLKLRYNTYLKAAAERKNYAPAFTTEENEALLRIVREHPELGWEERAELFAEAGVSDPAVQRSAEQLNRRYNCSLKSADERENYAPKFTTEEDDALMQIVQDNPKLGWEERANLFAEMMKDKSDVQRTAKQLNRRYHHYLKDTDERRKIAP